MFCLLNLITTIIFNFTLWYWKLFINFVIIIIPILTLIVMLILNQYT